MKRFVALLCTFCMALAIPAHAAVISPKSTSVSLVQGKQATSIEAMYATDRSATQNASLTDVRVSLDNGIINLRGCVMTTDGTSISVDTTGSIYRFRSESGMDTYLVDFTDSADVHFVQAKVESTQEQVIMKLVFQLYETEELLSFDVPLGTQISMKSVVLDAITDDNDAAFALYNMSKNVISPDTSTMSIAVSSENEVSMTVMDGDVVRPRPRTIYDHDTTVDDDVWDDFFKTLEDTGTVNLNDYEIDDRILETGWTFLHNGTANTGKYSLACYTAQNGSYDKIVQLTLLKMVHRGSSASFASLQMTLDQCILLTYNEVSEDFDVLYYNWGPEITDLKLALTLPGGAASRTVFTSMRVEANLPDEPDTLGSIIALVPYLNTAYDVWNILASDAVDTELDHTETYEDTYDKQYDEYKGKVRRVIAATTGDHELDRIGNSFLIQGDIYNGRANCSTWKYAYSASSV